MDAIQPTGLVCVEKWQRVGRNCLTKDWHLAWEESVPDFPPNVEDDHAEMTRRHHAMTVIFPGEIEEKIVAWLITGVAPESDEEGRYWRPDLIVEEPWDFLYICW